MSHIGYYESYNMTHTHFSDIKVYFIFQNMRTECGPVKCDSGGVTGDDGVVANDGVADVTSMFAGCPEEMKSVNRQSLTLVQSLILPILYCTLVGADHLKQGTEELRLKSTIVVMDLLDVLEV